MEGYDEGYFIELDTFLAERGVTDLTKLNEKVEHVKEAPQGKDKFCLGQG